ncbi:ecotropic viral integration site [Bulinus truncatus]|nr:ecotropic viral integration site [Bulinus truncatus]
MTMEVGGDPSAKIILGVSHFLQKSKLVSGPTQLSPGVTINGQGIDLNQNFTSPATALVLMEREGSNRQPVISSVVKIDSDKKASADPPTQGDMCSLGNAAADMKMPSEEELLKQLEEANRMLEADEKSHIVRAAFSSTPGHSRKGSGSSIVSSTSSNSFCSPQISNEGEETNAKSNPLSPKPKKTFKLKSLRIQKSKDRRKLSEEGQSKQHKASIRRGSQQSRTSSSSLDPNVELDDSVFLGSPSETLWEIWGRIINDWDSVKKKPTFLKELVRKGIPHEFRGMAWQMILGVHDSHYKQEYAEHMKKTSPCEKLIRRDIARTFPDHDFFKQKDGFGQESLFNVMKAYSLHDREVGYCQGSGFIVGLLLMQMPEEDAFAVLVRLMQDFKLRELFKPSMAELGLCMFKLDCLIQELLPTLLIHFQTQSFDTSMYASSWFLTLYVTSLPLSLARRIMDLFVSEGMEIIFRVGVAILQSCQEDLLALDMEGLLKYLQKDLRNRFEQEQDQENLLHTAYSIKYSQKKMKN